MPENRLGTLSDFDHIGDVYGVWTFISSLRSLVGPRWVRMRYTKNEWAILRLGLSRTYTNWPIQIVQYKRWVNLGLIFKKCSCGLVNAVWKSQDQLGFQLVAVFLHAFAGAAAVYTYLYYDFYFWTLRVLPHKTCEEFFFQEAIRWLPWRIRIPCGVRSCY